MSNDDGLKTEYEILEFGTRRAAKFPDGTIVPMIMGGSDDGDGDTGDGDTGSGDGDSSDGDETGKVEFTTEQQAKVQELIDESYKRAYSKAKDGAANDIHVKKLEAEVAKLKESKVQDKPNAMDSEEVKKAFASLKEEHATQMGDAIAKLESFADSKKTEAMLRSISRHNVVDAGEVCNLLIDNVTVDDTGKLTVQGEGGPVVNKQGVAMSVDEYIGEWLAQRPHHLRSSQSSGAGSQGNLGSGGGGAKYDLSDPSVWKSMPREDLDKILKEGVNVSGSAGQTFRFKDVANPFTTARKNHIAGGN